MGINKRVAIYLRVSTIDQSTALQAEELRSYAEARGWKDLEVYEDKATGTNTNRPELKRLLADARSGKISILLCWKLDRFARSLRDLVMMLQELSDLGVEFIALRDQIDMTTSTGRLLMHLIGAFGEFEASLIRERVRAGLANARAKGRQLGRPKHGKNEEIRLLRGEGLSIRQVAKRLRISPASVHRALNAG